MKNFKIGARALLVISDSAWQRLVTNTVNLKIGARAKVVVLTEQQRAELVDTMTKEIAAEVAAIAAKRAEAEDAET